MKDAWSQSYAPWVQTEKWVQVYEIQEVSVIIKKDHIMYFYLDTLQKWGSLMSGVLKLSALC